jgi:hypothetical protein
MNSSEISDTLELMYPLTPSLLINIHLNNIFDFLDENSFEFMETNEFEQIIYINSLQFENSNNFVYSKNIDPGFNWQVQHRRIWQKPQMGFCNPNTSSVLN